MEVKRLNEEEFKDICKEAIPHIEALKNILKTRGMKNLADLVFSQSGYVSFNVYDTGWELGRASNEKYSMKQTIEVEE